MTVIHEDLSIYKCGGCGFKLQPDGRCKYCERIERQEVQAEANASQDRWRALADKL